MRTFQVDYPDLRKLLMTLSFCKTVLSIKVPRLLVSCFQGGCHSSSNKCLEHYFTVTKLESISSDKVHSHSTEFVFYMFYLESTLGLIPKGVVRGGLGCIAYLQQNRSCPLRLRSSPSTFPEGIRGGVMSFKKQRLEYNHG